MKIYPCKKAGGIKIESLTITKMPTKTKYLVGTNLDLTGVEVTATAGLLSGDVASECEFDPADGTQLNTEGTQQVDVGFNELSTSFNVTVITMAIPKKLPYGLKEGRAVVYHNELYILGGGDDGLGSYSFYKWDGSSWTQLTSLPYKFGYGAVVVYNDEIHLMCGRSGERGSGSSVTYTKYANHYKWDGSSWTKLSNCPFQEIASAVVLDNEIYLANDNTSAFYKWDGSSWTQLTSLPYSPSGGRALVAYNNKIYSIGGYNGGTSFYRYDGSSWTQLESLPVRHSYAKAVVYNNEIHTIGCGPYGDKHYIWNGSSWTESTAPPYMFADSYQSGEAVVMPRGGGIFGIEILGSSTSTYYQYDAYWDGSSWTIGAN